ncbi:type II toxin-antitoxin system PemK/MazF family toxin [Xanthomonas citri]|uniref:type II toxin-antitoxin system PemK/MazF family toxin n=1 Tax=Xanthomonas citri TaxID=346 RepID=UPI000A6CDCDC|nr:type II toxin-antitoxin system PemK/MazF family toxin [Xanthomonas citri]QTJ32021.1 type II toxin-antitoxin system PemK/MazF family toxin [Xanthomonas citri pv. phaseoli var. fuscans]QTL00302.1 type II toxin-antitoxin system PemK/MazF family toxin [Xanthomonas citri pv. fuscans]
MPSIVVKYFERILATDDHPESLDFLGQESLDGVSEALIPFVNNAHKVFGVKKFDTRDDYRWFVESVAATVNKSTTIYEVILQKVWEDVPSVYLNQTIKKSNTSPFKLLRQGSLVEIEYGFVQAIGKNDGTIKTNKRYCDTIQHGEMHKRRLAVVVKVSSSQTVQVAPVTSVPPSDTDRTCFELSDDTLRKLRYYGNSGKRSWVICGMIETVSIRRILPPISYYTKDRAYRVIRAETYPTSIDATELRLLRDALCHSIGVKDYNEAKKALFEAKKRANDYQDLVEELNRAKADLADTQPDLVRLAVYEKLLASWCGDMGVSLEDEIARFTAG